MIARLAAGVLVVGAVAAPAAQAAYIAPGATIVSASLARVEQGDDSSTQPDISADGRFVVFKTASRNLFPDDVADPPGHYYAGGIYRRDLATGALDLVALGDVRAESGDTLTALGATSPSISGDGRYVAFTTGAALVAADTNGATDVYVRDMTLPTSDPAAYDLVSAKDGGDTPARYQTPTPDRPLMDPGADVSPGTSISDDGRMVAFSVREQPTDLPDHAAVDVPAGQVMVRDRTLERTTLVTRVAGTSPPGPISIGTGQFPPALGSVVISGDGSTVLWPGQQAGQQTRFLPGEGTDPRYYYYLWRRVADGPSAPTRRITGASDPDDPGCSGTYVASATAVGPCYGPLSDYEQGFGSITGAAPAMSADGRRILFTVSAPPRGSSTGVSPDLWLTDMSDGSTRKLGSVELTREGTGRDAGDSRAITGLTMSEDGGWAAIVTQRTRFLLPALTLLGDVRSVIDVPDVYLLDLGARTVQRAVHSYLGGDPDNITDNQLAMSADGRRLAFSSTADNLFFGDANQRPDVFVVDRLDAAPPAPTEPEPPADPPAEALPGPAPAPSAKLRVTVKRAPSGRVRLRVRAPAKGTITVKIRGKAPDRDGLQRGAAKLLASRTAKAKKKGDVTVDVTLAKRYRTGLRRAKSLDASADVRFKPSRGAALQRSISVRFRA